MDDIKNNAENPVSNKKKTHRYMSERMKNIRKTLNLTVPEMTEEMTKLGFVITYVTLNNYEKSLNKGISLDLLQYYIFKGINLQYLLKPNNEGEPIFSKDVKESNKYFTERRFVVDLLKTVLETIENHDN